MRTGAVTTSAPLRIVSHSLWGPLEHEVALRDGEAVLFAGMQHPHYRPPLCEAGGVDAPETTISISFSWYWKDDVQSIDGSDTLSS